MPKRYRAFWLVLFFYLFPGIVYAEPSNAPIIALLEAAKQGDNAKIQMLLNQGVDVNAMDSGYTALMDAAEWNHLATVKMLLDKGAFVEATNPYDSNIDTPLMIASYGWFNFEALPLNFNSAKPVKTKTDFHNFQKAVSQWQHGYYDIIQTLIEHGADVKVKDTEGRTPLLNAALGCDVQTLKLLLKHGADINAKTDGRRGVETPLISPATTAAYNDYYLFGPNNLKLLLAAGADMKVKNEDGKTVLDIARTMHRKDVVKILEAEIKRRKVAGVVH